MPTSDVGISNCLRGNYETGVSSGREILLYILFLFFTILHIPAVTQTMVQCSIMLVHLWNKNFNLNTYG